uniref:hypothetical protein n=1 Tax=Gemmiger formicilis TaxID=745368 RepID=UPI0040276726
MNKFLNNTRSTENEIPVSRKIRNTILILCLGIVLGTFSKFLDNTASNAIAERVEFEVLPTGEVQTFEMFDDTIKVKISKVDITTNEEL